MGKRKKSADLWEDTIVLALRDAQWKQSLRRYSDLVRAFARRAEASSDVKHEEINALRFKAMIGNVIPPGFVKLDGNAESALSDSALRSLEGDFFLIEVKPSREDVRDEWCPRKRKTSLRKGGVASKAVYPAVMGLVRDFNERGTQHDVDMLFRSIRCHQLAYWNVVEEDDVDENDEDAIKGNILVEPYINACVEVRSSLEVGEKKQIARPRRTMYDFMKGGGKKEDPKRMGVDEMLASEFSISLAAATKEAGMRSGNPRFGLLLEEFQKYVNWLCEKCTEGGGGVQPLNCIVLSTTGFFQMVSDTTQLARILELASQPKISRESSYD